MGVWFILWQLLSEEAEVIFWLLLKRKLNINE